MSTPTVIRHTAIGPHTYTVITVMNPPPQLAVQAYVQVYHVYPNGCTYLVEGVQCPSERAAIETFERFVTEAKESLNRWPNTV